MFPFLPPILHNLLACVPVPSLSIVRAGYTEPSTLPPRPPHQSSIPTLLTTLQSEYDAIMLESLEVKRAYQGGRQVSSPSSTLFFFFTLESWIGLGLGLGWRVIDLMASVTVISVEGGNADILVYVLSSCCCVVLLLCWLVGLWWNRNSPTPSTGKMPPSELWGGSFGRGMRRGGGFSPIQPATIPFK